MRGAAAFGGPGWSPRTQLRFFPDDDEMDRGFAHHFVTLSPRRILMPAGNLRSEEVYRSEGMDRVTVDMAEIRKAAGAIGCLTGILHRRGD